MHATFLQLGHLHIPIFGVFAAVGVMAALAVTQRTARYAHLNPDAVWSAGTTAFIAAFVISRLLLVAFNFRSFLQYPLLILALPSLTTTSLLVTALYMLGYIRWRRLPLLALLDAATPSAALLWGFVNLGRYFEGTRDGMPTNFGASAGNPAATKPQPVELITALAAFLLFVWILRTLKKQQARPAGTVTAIALAVSGFIIFFLDFFRLPSELLPNAWLDPAQIIALAMMGAGGLMLRSSAARTAARESSEVTHAI